MKEFLLGNKSYSLERLDSYLDNRVVFSEYELDVFNSIQEWQDSTQKITLYTSGSTGSPKSVIAPKSLLRYSAENTLNYLDLKPSSKSLCCLNVNYIAGKMMLVRSMVGDLQLCVCHPQNNPFDIYEEDFDFAAFVPLQLENWLQNPTYKNRLYSIRKIIVGGTAMSFALKNKCQHFEGDVYETYGMTETFSHIALKNVKTEDSFRLVYPEMEIGLDERGCLRFMGIITQNQWLQTNDLAEIVNTNEFKFLGRADFVINSGGIKINPTEIEDLITQYVQPSYNFVISSIPDERLGEKVVLVIEGDLSQKLDFPYIEMYKRPKMVINLKSLPLTNSGKIDRMKIKKIIFTQN